MKIPSNQVPHEPSKTNSPLKIIIGFIVEVPFKMMDKAIAMRIVVTICDSVSRYFAGLVIFFPPCFYIKINIFAENSIYNH